MTQAELNIYNFLARKLNVALISDVNALASAIQNNTADKRCVAFYFYDVYNIDTQETIATLWRARSGLEWFKTANNEVTEYYQNTGSKDRPFISYDLQTLDPIEYYVENGNILTKYDYNTNVELGHTTQVRYENLPDSFKEKLPYETFKNAIVYWAEKSYGRVVGAIKNN